MSTINDVHQQFAEYFKAPAIKPYLFALSQKMSEGHICIPVDNLDTTDLPEGYQHTPPDKTALLQHDLVGTGAAYKPFILHQDKLYLQRYFNYETQLLNRIHALTQLTDWELSARMLALKGLQPFIEQLFSGNIAQGPDWQLAAAMIAVLQNFTIITGGPGTGKTTTVAKILAILFSLQPDLKVALAAPTGKAAARMAESLMQTKIVIPDAVRAQFNRLQPATLHRLLGWNAGNPYFKHNAENPLPHDLIIIDESSMIDVAMFAKLLAAVGKGSRIILLGDKDQLASVEAGSLFGDLCKAPAALNVFSETMRHFMNDFIKDPSQQITPEYSAGNSRHTLFQHIVELRYSHRFKDDQAIGKISKAVIQNDVPALQSFLEHNLFKEVQIDASYDSGVFDTFIEGYVAICESEQPWEETSIKKALNHLNTLRILCAVKEGEQGVNRLNSRVEAYLVNKKCIQMDTEFYEHRPIMVTKNNYALGLYNGDIGILRKDANGIMRAWFIENAADGTIQLKSVLPGFITRMQTVFAMTIHKSQGSEFEKALVILPQSGRQDLLTRELLYTGITRAKEKVIIQSSKETFMEAAKAFVERGSGVTDRLRNKEKEP
jgi:exodeoxyribonuclease V alpha subunit